LVFYNSLDGNPDIYIANTDGTNIHNLTNNPADDLQPVVARMQ
jgi:Tol biopolymer transport system component